MRYLIIVFIFSNTIIGHNLDSLKTIYGLQKSIYNLSKCEEILYQIRILQDDDWVFNEEISIAELKGNHGKAVELISDNTLYAQSIVGKVRLTNNLIKMKDYESASIIFSTIDSSDYNFTLYEKAGDAYLGRAIIDTALEYYRSSIKTGNSSSAIFLKLSRLYVQTENYEIAKDILYKAVNLHPYDTKLLKLYTEVLFTLKDYLNTVNIGLRVIDKGDTTYSITQKLGLAYYFIAEENVSRGTDIKYRESLKYLRLSSQLDEKDPLNYFYIGMNYSSMEVYDSAASYFNKSIDSFYPSYVADVYIQLGSVFQKDNQYAKAIKNYRKAFEFAAHRRNILFYLANVYDHYYYDKKPAKNTYQKFLNNNNSSDQKLLDYANLRIEELVEQIHFRD